MTNNGCGTDFVLQQSGSQTVLRVVSQLSRHPVRQICIVLLQRLSRERLIEVNRLEWTEGDSVDLIAFAAALHSHSCLYQDKQKCFLYIQNT